MCLFQFQFPQCVAQQWDFCATECSYSPSFIRNFHTALLGGCTSLHSHQQCEKVPLSAQSSPAFVCRLFDADHSDQCEMIPLCVFDHLLASFPHVLFILLQTSVWFYALLSTDLFILKSHMTFFY